MSTVRGTSTGWTASARTVGGHAVAPTGAVAGYRPERTLRLRVELRRQFKRRRTLGARPFLSRLRSRAMGGDGR